MNKAIVALSVLLPISILGAAGASAERLSGGERERLERELDKHYSERSHDDADKERAARSEADRKERELRTK
jgi:hypothetical protein